MGVNTFKMSLYAAPAACHRATGGDEFNYYRAVRPYLSIKTSEEFKKIVFASGVPGYFSEYVGVVDFLGMARHVAGD